MTPGTERTPATRWHRLLALSQRWYVKLGVFVLGIFALFRFIPGGLLLTIVGVVFLAGWIAIMFGSVILMVPQLNEELDSWPDNWWTRWARPLFRVTLWATVGPWTLALLCLPLVFIHPAMLNTPFKTVVITLLLIATVPWMLIGASLLLLALAALIIALPIGIWHRPRDGARPAQAAL